MNTIGVTLRDGRRFTFHRAAENLVRLELDGAVLGELDLDAAWELADGLDRITTAGWDTEQPDAEQG